MNSGIYSLVARNKEKNEEIILPIKELKGNEVRYKVNISSIDKLTTYFKDEQELIKRLYDKKYINFLNADIYIKYKNNNVYNNIEVIYKDLNGFRSLITKGESTIEETNELFIQGCDNFFLKLNDSKIRNYVLNSEDINLKLKQDINAMYNSTTINEVNFYKRLIIKDLSNYRTFRNLTLVLREYFVPELRIEKNKKNQERNIVNNLSINEVNDKDLEEDLAKTMSINIPTNYSEQLSTKEYEEAKVWESEGKSINEMLDLDQILSMPEDELAKFGINKKVYEEYANRIYKK
ncbi:MAG: hypothetical protein J6K21_05970 [Bacilli bacterium]|nr:hypothetical protein [Bacilli bacterium]